MTNDPNAFNNPYFRKELKEDIKEAIDMALTPLVDKVNKIGPIVLEHDRTINRLKGALWVLGPLGTLIGAGIDWALQAYLAVRHPGH